MAKYYALISGLPLLTIENARPPISTEEFSQELLHVLTKKDYALFQTLSHETEHKELIDWLTAGELPLPELPEEKDYSYGLPLEDEGEASTSSSKLQTLRHIAEEAFQGKSFHSKSSSLIPRYQARFVYDLFFQPKKEALDQACPEPRYSQLINDRLALEDLLSAYYYKEAEQSSNAFIRSWATLNKNLRNILVVYTCRRLAWDASRFIIGDGIVEDKLRHSKAKDFDLSEELPYLTDIQRIAEERDIARRERLIDLLKWRWMDDWTFVRVFDLDNVLCYFLRLGILERWSKLDTTQGEATFRQIVHTLKGESAQVLQEFKHAQGHR